MKRIPSLSVAAIGILGTLVSIIALPEGTARRAVLFIFSILATAGLLAWLAQEIDLLSAWSILRQSKRLGIRRIHQTGLSDNFRARVAEARKIRIMAVSGSALVKAAKSEIAAALKDQRALIRVLVAEPNSQFVSDVESAESPHRAGQISREIETVKRLLYEFVAEASSGTTTGEIGRVEFGYFTTQLRSSLILCDDNWGWLTLNLPPKRAVQTVSFELYRVDNGLILDCIHHFDKSWELAEQRGECAEI